MGARRMGRAPRGRRGIAAILALGVAWGLTMHSLGWAQSSYYAQGRAMANGHAQTDRWRWQTKDEAWYKGHFYSVKAPGLAALTLPAYLALNSLHVQQL